MNLDVRTIVIAVMAMKGSLPFDCKLYNNGCKLHVHYYELYNEIC